MSDQISSAPVRPTHGWEELASQLPQPTDPNDMLWRQLEAQFRWYDRAGRNSRLRYQILRVISIVAAASTTVLAAVGAAPVLTASAAAVIVVLEGVQQLFQFHGNWIGYRSAAEALRQVAFRYVAEVPPFADADDRRDRLAALLGEITSKESAAWTGTMSLASKG